MTNDMEVISLSPYTLLATNQFICDLCYKSFQRQQNLHVHQRAHNLSSKLRQQPSNEVRKKVSVYPEHSCVVMIRHDHSLNLTRIKRHFCRKHGKKRWKCDKCS